MQIVSQNKNKRGSSGETNLVDFVICTGRISRHVEKGHFGRFRNRKFGIWDSRGVFGRSKKEFGGGEKKSDKDNRTKEVRIKK